MNVPKLLVLSLTSLYGLLNSVAVSVVGAVPAVIPELVLALYQTLSRTKRNRFHCFWPLGADVFLLFYQTIKCQADTWHDGVSWRLVILHQVKV